MIAIGKFPFLECSSKGDKRFSAFYAKPKSLNNKSIEEAYQAMKIFDGGLTNLSWREAKGKKAINQSECEEAYIKWWKEYIEENNLIDILKSSTGLSDMFGQEGHICQATVLWRIRNEPSLHPNF